MHNLPRYGIVIEADGVEFANNFSRTENATKMFIPAYEQINQ